MELGTDPADTPDSFLLRSPTTERSSDQDFRGTVLSGTACSPTDSLPVVSIFSIRCRRPFREVIRPPASTSAAVSARSCRRERVPGAVCDRCGCTRVRRAGTPNTTTGRFRDRVTYGGPRTTVHGPRAIRKTLLRARPRTAADGRRRDERASRRERERDILFLGYAPSAATAADRGSLSPSPRPRSVSLR